MQSTAVPHSAIFRTAEVAVGGDLIAWLTDWRGTGASYQFMAGKLAQLGVMVSHETVRSWSQRLDIPFSTAARSESVAPSDADESSPVSPARGGVS